ncbi:MAG: TonB-dependent receptor [Myxococcales bacterium]|nr:TonB-dependent receptor [Myxococcales bacterium]
MRRFLAALLLSIPAAAAQAHDGEPADTPLRVVGHAPPPTAGGRTVDDATLARTPRRTAEDLMGLLPGVYVVQHGSEGKGHQFYVRGFDALHGADVEVRVEGLPINEPSNVHGHGYVDLGFLVPELVLGLEATKGAVDVDQGDFGTAATVDFTVGVPRAERGHRLIYQVGTTGRQRAVGVWAPRDADERTAAAVEVVQDDGYGAERAHRRGAALGQATLWRRGRARLEVLGAAHHAVFGLPTAVRVEDVEAGRVSALDSYAEGLNGGASRLLGAVRFDGGDRDWPIVAQLWAQHRRLRLDENFTGFLGDAVNGDRHLQRQRAQAVGLRLRVQNAPVHALRLHLGLSGRSEHVAQAQEALDTAGRPVGVDRDLTFWQHHGALALGARWRPWRAVRLAGGARVDVFGFDVEDHVTARAGTDALVQVSPRLQLTAWPGDRWTLLAAAGRGLRSPEARAVVGPKGPVEDVSVARDDGGAAAVTVSDHVEAGLRYEPVDGLLFGAGVFGVQIDRERVFDHVSATNVEQGATRRVGLELEAQYRPAAWAVLSVDATVVDARFTADDRPVPGAPELLVRADATVVHPSGWSGTVGALVLGERPVAYGATAAGATVLDAALGHRQGDWRVDVEVENLLDTRWYEGAYHFASWWDRDRPRSVLPALHGFAAAPRQVRLGVTWWL